MKAAVYVTRARGVKLPRPNQHVHGNFLLGKDGRGDQEWLTARLTDGKQELLRPLIKAQVRRVTDSGMVVKGIEVVPRTGSSKSNSEVYVQVWWVFVLTHSAVDRYDGDDPLEYIADSRRVGPDYLVARHQEPRNGKP